MNPPVLRHRLVLPRTVQWCRHSGVSLPRDKRQETVAMPSRGQLASGGCANTNTELHLRQRRQHALRRRATASPQMHAVSLPGAQDVRFPRLLQDQIAVEYVRYDPDPGHLCGSPTDASEGGYEVRLMRLPEVMATRLSDSTVYGLMAAGDFLGRSASGLRRCAGTSTRCSTTSPCAPWRFAPAAQLTEDAQTGSRSHAQPLAVVLVDSPPDGT